MQIINRIGQYNKNIAEILAHVSYHIHPNIIGYICSQNNNDYGYFKQLFGNLIDLDNFLFPGSACVFPGVIRYVRGKGKKKKYNKSYKAIIDDNTFPRHIWCFLVNGKTYNGPNWKETKLDEFELAHIFTHKSSEFEFERQAFSQFDENHIPYGEFTCAANVVLLPKGTVRPTDNSVIIKSVFYKRFIDLYGENILGGRKGFNERIVPEWYKNLEWNEPFLPIDWKKNIKNLMEYRKKRITEIIEKEV